MSVYKDMQYELHVVASNIIWNSDRIKFIKGKKNLRLVLSNGGRDPEKKDRQEQHRPFVIIKYIDEATLLLLNSQKICDLAIFFL